MSKEQRTRHKRVTKYSESRQRGNVGEDIACLFLMKQGCKILERNYLKPWGELDIVCERRGKLYFVEVKSVSHETDPNIVSHETVTHETIRPEENMTAGKLEKLERTIKGYFIDHKISRETAFQLDLITVRIDPTSKKAIVERFEKVM